MDAKIIFHPFPIPEQTMQQNNTFREFHLSYIEKEGVLFARNKFGAKTRNRSSSSVSYTHLTLPTSDLV